MGHKMTHNIIDKKTLEYACFQTIFVRKPPLVMTCEVNIQRTENSSVIMDHFETRFPEIEHTHIAFSNCENQTQILKNLCHYQELNFLKMDPKTFMAHFPLAFPFIFVLFNKEKNIEHLVEQVVWFVNRTYVGSRFVFNEWNQYNNKIIKDILDCYNFKPVSGYKDEVVCYERFKRNA